MAVSGRWPGRPSRGSGRGCGKDAGSEGAVGPVLDELKPDANRVSKALRDGLGAMPSFKASLSEAEIAVLAYYVARASGGEK